MCYCNRNFQGQPSGWNKFVGAAVYIYIHYTPSYLLLHTKGYYPIPIPTFIQLTISSLRVWWDILIYPIFFHGDGTGKHISSHLNGIYERYIDCSINHRHRVDCYLVIHSRYFVLPQFYSRKAMSQPPFLSNN